MFRRYILSSSRLDGFLDKRSKIWTLFTTFFRSLSQTAIFLLLAKELGADQFGLYVSVSAIIMLILPFAEVGGFSMIVRDVSRGLIPNKVLGESIGISFLVVPLTLASAFLMAYFIYDIDSAILVIIFGVSELIGSRITTWVSAVFTAIEDFKSVFILEIVNSAGKFIAMGIFILIPKIIIYWLILYFLQFMFVVFAVYIIFCRRFGKINNVFPLKFERLREGLVFALGASAQTVYSESDKVVSRNYLGNDLTGIYGFASKITGFAALPLAAYLASEYPRFFITAKDGSNRLLRHGVRVIRNSFIISILVSLLMILISSYFTGFASGEFDKSRTYIPVLSLYICLQAIALPMGDMVTALGKQSLRSAIQWVIAISCLVLNIVLTSHFGGNALGWSLVMGQIGLIAGYIIAITWVLRGSHDG